MTHKTLLLLVSLATATLFAASADARTPSVVYRKPLRDVIRQMEAKWDVEIDYLEILLHDLTVEFADWKLEYAMPEAMQHVFSPLGLEAVSQGENKFRLRWLPAKFNYYELSEAEGKRRLDRLDGVYDTKDTWEKRRRDIRKHLLETLEIAGLSRNLPPHAILSPKREYAGYTVENLALETAPGVYLCGSLYLPAKVKGKLPAILSPHGHFDSAGQNPIHDGWGRYRAEQQLRCATLAKMGAVVFSYDMVAWGESSLQVPFAEHRDSLALTLQTWNSLRAVDYLLSRDDIDPQRLGVTGASGGGTQAFLLAALEDRIALSVPVVMVSCHYCGGCACESGLPIHFVPGDTTNNAEIAAMCAPRPQLIISDGKDWTRNTPNVEFPFIQRKYALCDAATNVEYTHFPEEGHDYGLSKRIAMYAFVAKHFRLDDTAVKTADGVYDESGVTLESAEKMTIFGSEKQLPPNAKRGLEEVREAFRNLK